MSEGPVAVVVPARNEEASLPNLLASLRPQLTDGDELVVVDDHSTDRTAAIAGANVLAAPPLPDGWTGKAWACWTGAGATTAPTLVFLDADVVLEPDGLDRIVAAHRGGLLSVQPFHVVRRPYERLSAFFNAVSMIAAFRAKTAFGPVLVTTRAEYDAAGGHEAVRGEVLEDVALARRYDTATWLRGKGIVSFRMYPGGLRQLVEGWSKNIAAGARTTNPIVAAFVFVWIAVCLRVAWVTSGWGLVAYGVVVAHLWWLFRRIGTFGLVTAVLYPIPLVFFVAVFVRSAVLLALGRVTWKGRRIATR